MAAAGRRLAFRDMAHNYTVDPLDVYSIPSARVHLLIGRRNSGKTTLLTDILYQHQNRLEFGIAIAGSIGSAVDIRKYHPDTYIYEDFDPVVLEKFWQKVRAINGKLRRRGEQMVNFYVILDDTGFDERMWNDKTLKAMMMNGRQYNLDMYMCLQYMKGITTSMRGQVDYCYIFKEKAPDNIKKLYDTFAGGYFENRFVFESVFRTCTLDHRALVVRNSDNPDEDGDFEGGILFYKASASHPPFTIGNDEMWRSHWAKYNDHYESDEEGKFESGGQDASLQSAPGAPRKRGDMSVQLRRQKPDASAIVKLAPS